MQNTDTNTAANVETPAAVRAPRPKPQIAILAETQPLADAMESILAPKNKRAEFTHIKRISERPSGAAIASLGMPSFIPGGDGVSILSFGSRYMDNATTEQRKAQWATLRDQESTVEEVISELNNYTEYKVLAGGKITEVKLAIADVRYQIAEAQTVEEELAAYKDGFNLLKEALG